MTTANFMSILLTLGMFAIGMYVAETIYDEWKTSRRRSNRRNEYIDYETLKRVHQNMQKRRKP